MRRACLACTAVVLVAIASLSSRSGDDPPPSSTPVTVRRAIGALHPRISTSGHAIVFSYQGAIWQIARTGGVMQRLTDSEGFDIEPAWSPNSKSIAFISSRNFFSGELRMLNIADRSLIKLSAAVQAQGKLQFHPDGRKLLGNFHVPGRNESLAWLDIETGNIDSVLDPPRTVRRPALSNDGRWIALATTLDTAGEQTGNDGPQNDLWKVPSGGGMLQHIVRLPARVHDICWANDGQSLFVTTDLGGAYYDLWQIPLSDSLRNAIQITTGQADEDRPSTCHSGRWLAFTDNGEGSTALMVRDLAKGLSGLVGVTEMDFGAPTGTLRLQLVDEEGARPIVARVTLEEKPGKFYAPVGALYRMERNNGHFYGRGQTEIQLPAGTYRLRAVRGPEYRMARREISIEPGRTTTTTVALARWERFAARSLYSGENHIHANYGYGEWHNSPQSMLDQCEGEDLNVCNFMVANSDGDGVFDRQFFRGEPDALSSPNTILYWNQEFRSTIWGHMTLVNLRQVVEPVFTGFKSTTNPWDIPTNADIADRAHIQRGLVNYTHPAQNVDDPYLGAYTAKGLPIDVALGKIDSIDVMGSNHRATVPLWYRLLNCGFRLPASAGTDCFLNRVRSRLPGSDRAYVRIDGDFSYGAWIDGLRSGRSLVTNGPLVELVVDGRLRPGETLELNEPREVRVAGKARAQFPLDRIELIHNGNTIASIAVTDHESGGVIDQSVMIERGGWLAIRTSGPAHPDHPGFELYAHTSPIYIRAERRAIEAAADARYFLAWIDRLAAALRQRDRIPTPEFRAHAEAQLDAARAIYRKIAESTE